MTAASEFALGSSGVTARATGRQRRSCTCNGKTRYDSSYAVGSASCQKARHSNHGILERMGSIDPTSTKPTQAGARVPRWAWNLI